MSSVKQGGFSSETEERYAMMDEKKRKRMISNRESARRSRMRKQKLVHDLTEEVGRLQVENNGIMGKIDGITEKYMVFAGENNVLRAQTMELTDRLKALNEVIQNYEMRRVENQESDPLLKPWQLPCSMQSIHASSSSGFFQL
ncbi:hypothetical protein M9H77_27365 [Catharanthus roseus]|uniref:Uncharacterized protein n=1 Tax=Catharanthus roseus TaxID=4058 RepID=A0ACC0AC93_CATRO|nr:hypothetical protein M9H77_27365 [Catharanthus roseus]